MTSFLQRYQEGHCQEVWADLLALGSAIQAEPLASEARAVAVATMQRVKHNIEQVLPRLKAIGYSFWGAEALTDAFAEQDQAVPGQLPIFAPPTDQVQEILAAIERKGGGLLPLSLRAFYEVVGTVNLCGEHPKWRHCRYLDALEVYPAEIALLGCDQYGTEADIDRDPRYRVPLAPDEYFKAGAGGSGPYTVALGESVIDAMLEGAWLETTFVDYLRLCFRWGGMPGWERCADPPLQDVAYLTEGLLPI